MVIVNQTLTQTIVESPFETGEFKNISVEQYINLMEERGWRFRCMNRNMSDNAYVECEITFDGRV